MNGRTQGFGGNAEPVRGRCSPVGRIAGVTAEETRERILASAAQQFAQKGYECASIAAIADAAGVTGGAIYAHYPSKAELFGATLERHGARQIEQILAVDVPVEDTLAMLSEKGRSLGNRPLAEGALLLEGIVASRRHPEVAAHLKARFEGREGLLTSLLQLGQATGLVDRSVPTAAASRFLLMLALGSLLVAALELSPVDEAEWTALIADLVGKFDPNQERS